MKKLLCVLFALLMLCGCGANEVANEDVKEEATWESQLSEDGVIYVGVSPDYPPFETLDDNGNIIGFDVDLFNAVAESVGLKVEWQAMEFDTIVSAVQAGTVDFGVSGFSYDPEKQVLFSDAYYDAGQTVLVLKESGFSTVEDLKGKTIAAQLGTTCAEAASEYIEDVDLQTGVDAALLVSALKEGQYDGVCLDTVVAENYVKNDSVFAMLDEGIVTDQYCMITNSANDLLMAKINEALVAYMATDAYNALIEEWGM